MFFASAAFLAGLALLTVPWWLHRLNAHAAEQRTFSSLFLMRASEAPVNMRKRLQHLLLLALRWLLLIAACLAFAEPIVRLAGEATAAGEPVTHRVLVIDTSLSMSQDDDAPLNAAVDAARAAIADLPAGAKAAIVTAAAGLELLVPLTEDRAELTAALADVAPSPTRLAMAGLLGRVSTLADTLVEPGELLTVYLYSDFQASGMPDQFNALVDGALWPTRLIPVVTPEEAGPNRAITGLRPGAGNTLDVTVRAFGAPNGNVTVALHQNGTRIGRETLFVAGNSTATVTFALPEAENARRRDAVTWTAELETADALAADNVRRIVRTDTVATTLPVLAADDRAWAYLRAAVQAAAPRFAPERLRELAATNAPVVAVLGSAALAGGLDREVRRYLESGGAVLLTVDADTRSAGRLPLIDAPLSADRFSQSPRGAAARDRSHPALAGFAGWQDLTFFQVLSATVDADIAGEVILTLDDGTPLLTEHRLGTGRLMILGTALDPAWSTLVVRPAFVSFTANLLGYLAEDILPAEALAGEPFAIPAQNVQLFDTDGERVLGLSETVGRPTVSLAAPGFYQLRTPSSSRFLAVNVNPAESDLAPIASEALARWQQSAERNAAYVAEHLQQTRVRPATRAPADAAASASRELPLAPWLLALLALLLIAEPLYANLFSGRSRDRGARRNAEAAT